MYIGDKRYAPYVGSTRRKVVRPLPYDAEIEYLESTGTQHIQTGIYPNTNLAYTIKLKRAQASSGDQIPFGSRNGE